MSVLKHGPMGSEHLDKTSHLDEISHLNETLYVHCISNHNENSWNMVCALGALNA